MSLKAFRKAGWSIVGAPAGPRATAQPALRLVRAIVVGAGSLSLGCGSPRMFSPYIDLTGGVGATSVAIGDFNRDGQPDLIFSTATRIAILLNTTQPGSTSPSFTRNDESTASPVTYGLAIATGDFNGDGAPDIVSTVGDLSFDSHSVSVLLNTTNIGATTPAFAEWTDVLTKSPVLQNEGISFGPPLIADFNGDGKSDLAVLSTRQVIGGNDPLIRTLSILINTTATGATTPSFINADVPTTEGAAGPLMTADFNGDGTTDIAFADIDARNLLLLFNATVAGATTPSFAPPFAFRADFQGPSFGIGDFNQDGMPDLALPGPNRGWVLVNNGGRQNVPFFSTATFQTSPTSPTAVAVGDLDLDGKPDLAVASVSGSGPTDVLSIILNTSEPGSVAPSFAEIINFSTAGTSSIVIGDFNRDGRPDLVVGGGSVSIFIAE